MSGRAHAVYCDTAELLREIGEQELPPPLPSSYDEPHEVLFNLLPDSLDDLLAMDDAAVDAVDSPPRVVSPVHGLVVYVVGSTATLLLCNDDRASVCVPEAHLPVALGDVLLVRATSTASEVTSVHSRADAREPFFAAHAAALRAAEQAICDAQEQLEWIRGGAQPGLERTRVWIDLYNAHHTT